jgi:hypothetical protein
MNRDTSFSFVYEIITFNGILKQNSTLYSMKLRTLFDELRHGDIFGHAMRQVISVISFKIG